MRATKEVKAKRNKGITLIALVITIIVMLILVVVTVTMAVKEGLFEKAGTAARDTQIKGDAEKQLGSGRIKIGGIWYDSPQDFANGKKSLNQDDGYQGDVTTGVDKGDEPDEQPKSPYIGCYADLDGDGEIETDKDGIIYADLGVGNTKGEK